MEYPSEARVLLYDIETAPIVAYTWGPKWETNIIKPLGFSWILCFAYRWLGETETHVVAQPDFRARYKDSRKDDYSVVKELHRLFEESDVRIAHNGIQFDEKTVKARMAFHGLTNPGHSFPIDTKNAVRRHFRLPSNSLNDVAQYFDLGAKLQHTGFDLWERCMAGDDAAWSMMKAYNVQDVELLERLYLKLRDGGWIDNHPNLANISGLLDHCPKCLAPRDALRTHKVRPYRHTPTRRARQLKCSVCNSYSTERITVRHHTPDYK